MIAQRLGTTVQTVSKWRRRYRAYRLAGLTDAPRAGRPRSVGDEQVQLIVDKVRQSKPDNATHWSVRQMSRHAGVSPATVQRIWRAFGLKPPAKHSELSTGSPFRGQGAGCGGTVYGALDRALVLCVERRRPNPGLDRTQPGLPLTLCKPSTRTHDYKRHGATSLFAALDVAAGRESWNWLKRRHRSVKFLQFLKASRCSSAGGQDVHLIARTTTARTGRSGIRAWYQPPRYHVHFTPTSGSNLVERFFSQISEQWIKQRPTPALSAGAIHVQWH